MQKKKILYVITKSNFGGAQRYIYDLATTLPQATYEPTVAFGGTGAPGEGAGKLDVMLKEAGVRTIFIKNFARDIFIFKEFDTFFELIRLFKKEKPDVVHLNSSKAGGVGSLAARLAGVPRIVFTVHGWAYNEPVPIPSKAFRWVASLFTTLLSHEVITVSNFDMLHSPLHLPTTTIHNGIEKPEFLSRDEARKKINSLTTLPSNAFIIGSIAELHTNKGLDNLIHAVTSFEEGHIVIMGEGEQRTRLEKLIAKFNLENRIHILGFVDDAKRLLTAFDIFVLPSRKEGLPYTILEAGFASLPVVATAVGGIPEIIEDQISGELVHMNDCPGLAKDLQKLVQSPNTRARYGEALHEKVTRCFNLRGMAKRTIELYEE